MKAIPVLLFGLASLMGADLQPVSAIDFSQALRIPPHHLFIAIAALGATPDGVMVSRAMGCDGFEPGIARAARTGANITRIDFPAPYRNGGDVVPAPDGSWWLESFGAPSLPGAVPCMPPGSPPGVYTGFPVLSGPQQFRPASGSVDVNVHNFDLFAKNGKLIESFREIGAGKLAPWGAPSPSQITPGSTRIALASTGLIRVGHVTNGAFVSDREWQINSSYVIVPLAGDSFGVVNRFSGQLTVIDPATPDTRVAETHITAANARMRPLVAGANDSIWFLLSGSGDKRDLVQFAADGQVLSRNTLRMPARFKPFRLAISGRDVYLAGFGAIVYRYELP